MSKLWFIYFFANLTFGLLIGHKNSVIMLFNDNMI